MPRVTAIFLSLFCALLLAACSSGSTSQSSNAHDPAGSDGACTDVHLDPMAVHALNGNNMTAIFLVAGPLAQTYETCARSDSDPMLANHNWLQAAMSLGMTAEAAYRLHDHKTAASLLQRANSDLKHIDPHAQGAENASSIRSAIHTGLTRIHAGHDPQYV